MGRSRRRKGLRYSPRRTLPFQQPPAVANGHNREEFIGAIGCETVELHHMVERPPTPADMTINALYVDVVKKRQHEESDYEEPVKPIEFTMSKKDFPALPGTNKKPGKTCDFNDDNDNDAAASLDEDSSSDEFVSYDGDNEHDDDDDDDFSSASGKTSSCDGAVGGNLNESDVTLLNNSRKLYSQIANSSNLTNLSSCNFEGNFNASTPTASHIPPPPGFEDTIPPVTTESNNLKSLTLEAEELRIRLQQCLAANYNKRIVDSSLSGGPANVYPTMLGNKYGILALANTLNQRYMAESFLDTFDETFAAAFAQPPKPPSIDPYVLGVEIDATTSSKLHESFAGPFGQHSLGPGNVFAPVPESFILHERVQLHPPKMSQMESELLFYFFYLYPGDMLQLLAAAELAQRNWRFHIREKTWLRRQDGFPTYVFVGNRECGMFNYFSYNRWKICEHYFEIDLTELEHTTTRQELYNIYGFHPQMG